uniref:Transglutaminase C-terminal domain-containing protein n=1 Tax=Eptatretus burgeri TaxID=7764 RepID=A0A8C4R579_EPTBU
MTVVGQNISTKVMGSSSAREDITLQYKFPEGSEEERMVVQKATRIANPDSWFSSGRSDEFSFPVEASSRMSNISNVEMMYNSDRSADVPLRLARRNDDPTIMSSMTTSIGPVAMFDSSRLSRFERHGIMANRAICAISETPDQSTKLIIEMNENTTVGKPLNAKVRVINESSAIRTIKLKILGHVVTYTGNVVGKFYDKDVELKLQASQGEKEIWQFIEFL